MDALISIIIPAYNRANLILDAINSVLSQTYENFEIIVVDDGSTDNTKEIIENIKDSRIKYIYQKNAGPSAARNNGIKNADGEWIAFLDSDDLWMPKKLEKQIEVIKNNPDINLGMVSCWAEGITFDNKLLYRRICKAQNSKGFIKGFFINPDNVISGTPAFIVKKECFEKVGYFDETMISLEDWDMWLRIVLEYEFRCVNEVLTSFRTHNSLSVETPLVIAKDSYLRLLEKIFNNNRIPEYLLKNKIYSNAYFKISLWGIFNANGNQKIAREALLKSLRYNYLKLFDLKFIAAFMMAYNSKNITNLFIKIKNFIKNCKQKNLCNNNSCKSN